jgi:carboxylesterase
MGRQAACDTFVMLYGDATHQSFTIAPEGPPAGRAALLLHGFLGTPAELRPLAALLAEEGVTATAPALPGFGQDVERLRRVRLRDWLAAAREAWASVQRSAETALLVGFSMGGALALAVAAESQPDALLLIDPFRRIHDPRARFLPVARYVMPDLRLYEGASFADPHVRDSFALSGRGLDLGDPEVQDWIRANATLPVSALAELQRAGEVGFEAAVRVRCPTLILKSSGEEIVTVAETEELARPLGGPTRLEIVRGDHQLVRDDRASWSRIRELVAQFGRSGERP